MLMTHSEQINRSMIQNEIQNSFSELQKKLETLKNEVKSETNETKKQDKDSEIQKMKTELKEIKNLIDKLSSLQDEELQSLKNRLESYSTLNKEIQWDTADLLKEKSIIPTTYELLKDSETANRLLNIISSNPKEFKNLPWDDAEKKLEYIFAKIRNWINLFLKNKFWNSENYDKIINNTIVPAFERNLMELLRDQWNENNISMLKWLDKISWKNLENLISGVSNFAKKTSDSFNQFNARINAVDYLSVHNWVLREPNKSEVLSNPLKFKEYLNDPRFAVNGFSPYAAVSDNIFKIDESQNFEFGMSVTEKQAVLEQIWNIQVVNNPKTTALIVNMLDKPEQFLQKTQWLQQTANGMLDWLNSVNWITKMFWFDLIWEISKSPEKRTFLFKIFDFVCKLIWFTWWAEWIVRKWRLDRLSFTEEKNENISQIFWEYKKLTWENLSLSITDENSCKMALNEFSLTDPNNPSISKWDHLRDSIAKNIDINLISPAVVKQILWDSYLKKEQVDVKWNKQERVVVDASKISENDKLKLAHGHVNIMKNHLTNYKDLQDFYTNIHSTQDLVLCIVASLYADKDDVIEWIKAKVFLPENYGAVRTDGAIEDSNSNNINLSELSSAEKTEMQNLVEQSKSPNRLCYLENTTYKKYLNIIERDLNLPRYALECVCKQESLGWYLYDSKGNILWSRAWAKWLFQFMPWTADQFMKHKKLGEKYWKTFTSRDEFLRDPLASAWAAWIMYSEFMYKYNYNFQSSLACYNRWIWKYINNIWKWNLTWDNFNKLPKETKNYVQNIIQDVLKHNSISSTSDVLLADLWQYSRNEWDISVT